MREKIFVVAALAASLGLAACGGTTEQRAATGGLGGAAAGALVGGPVGAVIGGAAGAGTGAVLDRGVEDHAQELMEDVTE